MSRRATPSPEVALAWGSQSMMRTRRPISARWAATLITVVVLPTPPFWLATARTRGGMAAIMRRRGEAEPGERAVEGGWGGRAGRACFTVMIPVKRGRPVIDRG